MESLQIVVSSVGVQRTAKIFSFQINKKRGQTQVERRKIVYQGKVGSQVKSGDKGEK